MSKVFLLFFVAFTFFECHSDQSHSYVKLAPSDWFYTQRAFPHDKLDYRAYNNAVKILKQTTHTRSSQEGYNDPWQIVGPTNINGRITDIEMPIDNVNTIYAATASGGIFKSTNQGDSWSPIFDEALSLSIGDMAIAPSNQDILYVGTGEANAGGGSLAYDGVGVYRSDDAGQSWSYLGLEDVGSIGRVMINPVNPDEVYVAAMGRLFGENEERGVYKTTDGGATWDRILFQSEGTGAIDLAINQDNPDIVYAAMWQRERKTFNRTYGGDESGIFRSIDGGATWEELSNGIPTGSDEKGRIGIAIAPTNPDILYAMYAKTNGFLQGMYKTNNGGASWFEIDKRAINDVPFIWWFGKVFVHPFDEDIAYATSLDMFRTTNGGDRWLPIFEAVHVDHHALFVHPMNPDLVVNGNDGGVYLSQDGGRTFEYKNSLPNLQFYTVAIDNTNPEVIFGGTQDNGTLAIFENSDAWETMIGGDGFRVMSHPFNPDLIFAESQFGNIRKSENGGQTFGNGRRGISGQGNWNTPYILDPINPDIMYAGTNRVFRSDDQGNNWEAITGEIPLTDQVGNIPFGTITSLSVSPLNNDFLFAGTDDGRVVFLNQQTANLTDISDGLPQRWVTAIAADLKDENTVYITLSGFRFDESGAHVFKSTDLGESWNDISTSLPDVPVNDIIVDPQQSGLLYIATDIGVYFSENDGNEWELLGTDLPLVPVTDIDLHTPSNKLAAATYGRSIHTYILPLPTSTNEESSQSRIALFPNPATDRVQLVGLEKDNEISVFDVGGMRLIELKISEDFIDVSTLKNGVYFLMIEGQLYKFVKL